jgi:zinc transporter 7
MSFQASAFAFLFPGSAMTNSILATAYISIFPNLLLYFVPPDINTGSLNVLVSFAVGNYGLHSSHVKY